MWSFEHEYGKWIACMVGVFVFKTTDGTKQQSCLMATWNQINSAKGGTLATSSGLCKYFDRKLKFTEIH